MPASGSSRNYVNSNDSKSNDNRNAKELRVYDAKNEWGREFGLPRN